MASISRLTTTKDCCRFNTTQAFYKGSSVLFNRRRLKTNLDLRVGFSVTENERSCAIRCKPRSPIVALGAPLSIVKASRHFQVMCKAAANVSGDLPSSSPCEMSQYERIIETLTTLFPVWVILGTIIGIYKPSAVTWLETDLFTVGLGFLMLSMGLTLTFEDFRRCLRNPWTVGVGFLAQYLIKPMLGFVIAMPGILRVINSNSQ